MSPLDQVAPENLWGLHLPKHPAIQGSQKKLPVSSLNGILGPHCDGYSAMASSLLHSTIDELPGNQRASPIVNDHQLTTLV
jgi:hypothetical protein